MVNPVVQIQPDTINIMEVDIFSDPQDDSENARENVESIDWDLVRSLTTRSRRRNGTGYVEP